MNNHPHDCQAALDVLEDICREHATKLRLYVGGDGVNWSNKTFNMAGYSVVMAQECPKPLYEMYVYLPEHASSWDDIYFVTRGAIEKAILRRQLTEEESP